MTVLDRLRGMFGQATIDQLAGGMRDQEWLREQADMGGDRIAGYTRRKTYYDGEQETKLDGRAKAYLEASGQGYVENFCKPVLDARTNRLRVTSLEVQGNDDATTWLNDSLWGRNRMGIRQRIVHHQAGMFDDAFILVEPDVEQDMVCLRRQEPSRIKPVYGDDDEDLQHIVKVWDTSKRAPLNPTGQPIRRMNLCYPDRIEKYFTVASDDGAEWLPWFDDEDQVPVYEVDEATGEQVVDGDGDPVQATSPETAEPLFDLQWPTPWTMDGEPDGEPIGILIIHFRYDPTGGESGRSILRDVIPLQDRCMYDLLNLFEVQDNGALAVPWISGNLENAGVLTIKPGDMLKLPDGTTAGRFDPVDPRPAAAIVDGTIRRISGIAATPVHILLPGGSGALPSGETLKTAEAGLVKAAEGTMGPLGMSWEQVAHIAARVGQAFGITGAPEIKPTDQVSVVWEDAESRNEESEATTLEAHIRMGLSKKTALTKLGYNADDELEQSAQEQKATLKAQQAAFNAGRVPGIAGGRDQPPADGENAPDKANGES